jgi:hypothetical protein
MPALIHKHKAVVIYQTVRVTEHEKDLGAARKAVMKQERPAFPLNPVMNADAPISRVRHMLVGTSPKVRSSGLKVLA